MSKRMKIIFTLSLMANILLVGFVGAKTYQFHQRHSHWKDMREQLKPETRDLMKQSFKERKPQVKEMFMEMREKKKVLEDVYAAEEFDPVAYDMAAKQLEEVAAKLLMQKREAFKKLGTDISHEERRKLAPRVSSSLFGKHGGKGYRSDRKKASQRSDHAKDAEATASQD